MRLTPDGIASRAFTPSVDGYHQAEVRSFLERVAGHVQSLQNTPDDSSDLAELTAAVQDREPRLAELERKLGELVADLAAATNGLSEAEAGPVVRVPTAIDPAPATASAADAAERETLRELQAALRAQHESLVAQQQSLTEQQQAFETKQANFEAQQQAFAANQKALNDQQLALAEQQQSLSEQQEMLGEHLDDTRKLAKTPPPPMDPLPTVDLPPPAHPAPQPAPPAPAAQAPAAASGPSGIIPQSLTSPELAARPGVAAAAAAAEADTLAIFASDLDDQPLFSDSANDLLDGVLDDVMGDITEEGKPT